MNLGLNLINRGPLATPRHLTAMATRADALGFTSMTISDHIVLVRDMPDKYPYSSDGSIDFEGWANWHDCLALMGFVAGCTTRLRFGTSVLVVPYRNPLVTAKQLATLDSLSGGRIFFGVGTGWWQAGVEAMGLGGHFRERGERTDEYVAICKTLWTQDVPSFMGRFHRFDNLEFSPKPVQRGGIPIWVAGHTGRALRRMADLGDVWHPVILTPPANLNPEELRDKRRRLEALYRERGRDPETIRIIPKTYVEFTDQRTRLMSGRPGQIVEDLRAYAAEGVEEMILTVPGAGAAEQMESLQRIAEEILPHVM